MPALRTGELRARCRAGVRLAAWCFPERRRARLSLRCLDSAQFAVRAALRLECGRDIVWSENSGLPVSGAEGPGGRGSGDGNMWPGDG